MNHKTKGETNEGNIRKLQKDSGVQKAWSFAKENGDKFIGDADEYLHDKFSDIDMTMFMKQIYQEVSDTMKEIIFEN